MTHVIALVDDDKNILTSVSMALEEMGYKVRTYPDSTLVIDALIKNPVDLGIFDIKMPGIDGIELLKELRQTSQMPVIFLTSKDSEIDELLGFKMGADDYITKPFSQNLLLERVKALTRRIEYGKSEIKKPPVEILERGNLKLDFNRHICSWHDQELGLTVTEFLLLKTLIIRIGHVKSREQLIEATYGESIYADERTIDSHIKRLRNKIKALDPEFDSIETIYGIGYRYKDD